jgi:hypothetical protein
VTRATVTTAAAAIGALAIALVSVQRRSAQETASQSVSGRIVTYEASDSTLTLRTENGDRYFMVSARTPLREGAKAITLADLASADGCPAKVSYRDAEGQLIASEVRVLCATVSHQVPSRRQ